MTAGQFLVACVLLNLACVFISRADASDSLSIDDVVKAFQQREEAFISLHAEWSEDVFIPKKSWPVPSGEFLPNVDAKGQRQWWIKMQAPDMLAYGYSGDKWSEDRMVRHSYANCNDGGGLATMYYGEAEVDSINPPLGGIGKSEDPPHCTYCMPLQLHYLPMRSKILFRDGEGTYAEPSKYEITEVSVLVEGVECRVVQPIVSRGAAFRRIYVSPRHDMAIVQFESVNPDGSVADSFTVNRFNASNIPVEWTTRMFLKGVAEVTTAHVTSSKVGAVLPRSDFVYDFPAGTYVQDTRTGELETFVVKADGGQRRVTPQERDARPSVERLMATQEGELAPAGKANTGYLKYLVLPLIGLIAVSSVVFLLFRKAA